MRRELLTLGMTASILVSLLVFTQPTAAVLTTVSGPDEVQIPGPMEFETAVEIREDERVPIESFDLLIRTEDGGTVTITFAPDGTVQSIEPAEGTVGNGEIRVDQLRESLEITPVESNADFGYGYGSGTNERTGESRSFGYGYGYGYGGAQPSFEYRIAVNSTAFAQGEYTMQLRVNTDGEDGVFASNEKVFEIDEPGEGPPDDLPEQASDRAHEVHDVIQEFRDGLTEGPLGQAIQDLAGNGNSADADEESNGNGQSDDRHGGNARGDR